MVIGEFHPVIGGAQRQCLKLSKELIARGHTVNVVTVWNPRNVQQKEEVEGVSVFRVWYPPGLGFLAPLTMFYQVLRSVNRFDCIHVHQALWPAAIAVMVGKFLTKPVIVKIGNAGERFDLRMLARDHWFGPFASRLLIRSTRMFVATSGAVATDLGSAGIPRDRISFIPNGVNSVSSTRQVSGAKPIVRFIFVGSLTPKKNLSALVRAMALLKPHLQRQCELLIVGDGPDRSTLVHIQDAFGLHTRVRLIGERQDVTALLKESTVFILPSFTEGLSNAALEAMSCALPIIVSARGGNIDLVELSGLAENHGERTIGTNGLLLNRIDPESISSALEWMLDHQERLLPMGNRSREIIHERFTIERAVSDYERLYEQCCSPADIPR